MTTNTEQAVERIAQGLKGWARDMYTVSGIDEADLAMLHEAADTLLSQEAKKDRDDGWQDIATAPKDGTEILLRRGERVGAAAWVEWEKRASEYHANGTYLGEYVQDGGASWTIGLDGNSWDGERKPTHWRPLPAPPAPSEGEAS